MKQRLGSKSKSNLKIDMDVVNRAEDDFYKSNSFRASKNKQLYESPHPRDPMMPNV